MNIKIIEIFEEYSKQLTPANYAIHVKYLGQWKTNKSFAYLEFKGGEKITITYCDELLIKNNCYLIGFINSQCRTEYVLLGNTTEKIFDLYKIELFDNIS